MKLFEHKLTAINWYPHRSIVYLDRNVCSGLQQTTVSLVQLQRSGPAHLDPFRLQEIRPHVFPICQSLLERELAFWERFLQGIVSCSLFRPNALNGYDVKGNVGLEFLGSVEGSRERQTSTQVRGSPEWAPGSGLRWVSYLARTLAINQCFVMLWQIWFNSNRFTTPTLSGNFETVSHHRKSYHNFNLRLEIPNRIKNLWMTGRQII